MLVFHTQLIDRTWLTWYRYYTCTNWNATDILSDRSRYWGNWLMGYGWSVQGIERDIWHSDWKRCVRVDFLITRLPILCVRLWNADPYQWFEFDIHRYDTALESGCFSQRHPRHGYCYDRGLNAHGLWIWSCTNWVYWPNSDRKVSDYRFFSKPTDVCP